MRIIAGTARGRRFDAPKGMDTRPTLDRVKESVFGMLQFDIPGSSVLDLFSGSGNLGLEAASRGAKTVVCNDRSRDCAEQIEKNAALLGLSDVVRTLCMDYAACIGRLKGEGATFDFVFLDAPYRDGTARSAAEAVVSEGLLKPGGRIVVEHAANLPPQVSQRLATCIETRQYGSCAVSFYRRASDEA
ncbi:MAG: 16S rRNA (guanine(966)-N(2))-methyltransferase RsmD [Clostridiales bacterium]|nr:16S rRNA (guanine(966)-N(2))-methyltransferase RsmD [Clostridiales bacterium]